MENVMTLTRKLLQSADLKRPFAEFVDRMVEAHIAYFQDPIPRVVYIQYFVAPQLFVLFDESFNHQLIEQYADFLRQWNPTLPIEKSECLAETVHQCYNALLLQALRGEEHKRRSRYAELKASLVAYLAPHVEPKSMDEEAAKVMKCHYCYSDRLSKNGHRYNKQRYLCKDCGKQFLERTDSRTDADKL